MTDPPLTLRGLAELDDDELQFELGKQLLGEGLPFGPGDSARYRRFAEKWLTDHLNEIRQSVCGAPSVVSIRSAESSVPLIEAATVADALAALYGRPAAMVAAIILVRRGLAALCRDA